MLASRRVDFWVLLGLIGQAMSTMRFIVQWIAFEKRKKSVTSVAFWHFSSGEGLLLLAYAIRRTDPVFGCLSSQPYYLFWKPFLYLLIWVDETSGFLMGPGHRPTN